MLPNIYTSEYYFIYSSHYATFLYSSHYAMYFI